MVLLRSGGDKGWSQEEVVKVCGIGERLRDW